MDKIDENTRLRFLMSNKWDVDVTISELKATREWIRDNGAENIDTN